MIFLELYLWNVNNIDLVIGQCCVVRTVWYVGGFGPLESGDLFITIASGTLLSELNVYVFCEWVLPSEEWRLLYLVVPVVRAEYSKCLCVV